ncbi:MAG: uncharacterized protein KVP18_000846 [Porospora cf. gigantea A]|uniref:uncharacterized protein n=1 Tax=Porospora cf. gigantea A TaxID=2853593 RepID=UPI003559C569|nr:MAG: hypothetical protein KVP18_000846 [Porospora cf. gigantea A]
MTKSQRFTLTAELTQDSAKGLVMATLMRLEKTKRLKEYACDNREVAVIPKTVPAVVPTESAASE